MTALGEPAPGALRRGVGIAVTVLAVACSVLSSFLVFGADAFESSPRLAVPGWYAGLGFLLALGAAAALCWRHRAPVTVTAAAVVPPLLFPAESLAALIALAALAAHRRGRVLWLGTGAVFLATGFAVWRDAHRNPDVSVIQITSGVRDAAGHVTVPLIGIALIAAVLTAIPVGVGTLRRARREVWQGERQREVLRAEMARQDERTRIAREMHDVLGHRLSQLSVQAGALEVAQQVDAERAADTAHTVRATTRAALDDLRYVVGVLRDGDGFDAVSEMAPGPQRPQPTLEDIPELLASSRRSGLTISSTVLLDDAAAAPVALGTATYRVVQESLTNVLRHARTAPVEVTVRGGRGRGVTIEVSNPVGTGGERATPGSGNGLTGIAERVAQLDGTVSTGPTGEGTFEVKAWLPWPP